MRILKILPVFPVVAKLGATAAIGVPDPHMIIFPDSKILRNFTKSSRKWH